LEHSIGRYRGASKRKLEILLFSTGEVVRNIGRKKKMDIGLFVHSIYRGLEILTLSGEKEVFTICIRNLK
jgi:hypothetical protein